MRFKLDQRFFVAGFILITEVLIVCLPPTGHGNSGCMKAVNLVLCTMYCIGGRKCHLCHELSFNFYPFVIFGWLSFSNIKEHQLENKYGLEEMYIINSWNKLASDLKRTSCYSNIVCWRHVHSFQAYFIVEKWQDCFQILNQFTS